jgi:hypothetical protein
MCAIEDEFSKFERKERAFRQADRQERAARLRLPISFATDHPPGPTLGRIRNKHRERLSSVDAE